MAQTIDERIVEMRIDNEQFERGAQVTLGTLGKLRDATNFGGGIESIDKLQKGFSGFDTSPMAKAIEKVQASFSALEVAGMRVISNLTDSVYRFAANTVKELTVEPVNIGWNKLEEKAGSVQTIMNSTGLSVQEVEKYLEELLWYSDETSFGFTDMTTALATMTSSGGDIEKLIPMIMGIGNAVAYAGKGAAEFKRSIMNLNQSYSGGYLTLMDWRSLQLAGTNSKALMENLIATAEAMGKIKQGEVTIENFTETLKDKWADKEVMERAFGYFAEMSVKAKELIDAGVYDNAYDAYRDLAEQFEEIQAKAAQAAQECRSFKDVISAIQDAASTGWMTTFENIFGNFEEQRDFWGELYDALEPIFLSGGKRRNSIFEIGFGTGVAEEAIGHTTNVLNDKLGSIGKSVADFKSELGSWLGQDRGLDLQKLIDKYGSLEAALGSGEIKARDLRAVLDTLQGNQFISGENHYDHLLDFLNEGKITANEFSEAILTIPVGMSSDYYKGFEKLAESFENGSLTSGQFVESLKKLREETKNSERIENNFGTLEDIIACQKEAEALYKNLSRDIKHTVEQIKGTDAFKNGILNIIKVVEDLQGAWRNAVDSVFGSVDVRGLKLYQFLVKFYDFTERIQLPTERLERFQKIFENILEVVSNVAHAFKPFISVISTVGKTLLRFGEGLLDGLFSNGWIAKSSDVLASKIERILLVINALLENAIPAIEEFGERVGRAVSWIVLCFTALTEDVKPMFGRFVTWLLDQVGELIPSLSPKLSKISDFIRECLGLPKKVDGEDSFIESYQDFLDKLAKIVSAAIAGVWASLTNDGSSFEEIYTKVYGIFSKIHDVIIKVVESVRIVGQTCIDILPDLEALAANGLIYILELIGRIFPSFKEATDNMVQTIKEKFGTQDPVTGAFHLPTIQSVFDSIVEKAGKMVKDLLDVLGFEGLEEKFNNIKAWAEGAFQSVKDFFSGNTVSNDGLNGKVNETQGVLEAAFSWFSGDKVTASVVDVDGMFPSQETIGEKAEGFWTNTLNTIKSKFGSVSLSKMFDLGKLGILAYTLMSVNRFINSVKITVDPRKNGLFGVMDSLKKTISNIGSPFAAFAKKITTEARADEMIKLAAAIGILSLSLMGLSMLDEQTLFNVSAVMMGLMLVLKGLSGAGNGIQIFSNNVKKVTGDVSATFDVLKNFRLKDMKAFFENISLEVSVIPKTMGTLLGLATLFGVIAIVFLKIKDIKSVEEVLPALEVIGIVLGAIVVVLGIAAAVSKHMKGMGATFLGMALAFVVIGEALKAIQNIEWSVGGIFGAVTAIAVFGMLLWAVSDLIDSKNIEKISGKKMLAFAASIMLLGVTFSTIGATLTLMSMFAKPEGLLMAGVALTAVALGMAAIVKAFSKVPAESSMVKAAASMMIIALALQMMAVPIVLLSAIALVLGGPMIAVSVGLAMFSAVMATIIGVLSAYGGDHLLQAAGSLVIVSVALGVISLAITNIASLDLASMAESCVALIAVLAVMALAIGYLSSDKVNATKLIEGSVAMLALAVAVAAVGVGIGAIASLDIGGIAAATVALGLMIGVMSGLLVWLSKIETSKLAPAAAAMVLAAVAVDVLALGLAGLTVGFVNLVQNGSWEEFGAKAKAMGDALEPLSGWIIGIGVAFVGLIAIAALAGDKLGLAGLGIAGVGVGVLAVVYAFSLLPAAVQGIVDAMDILNKNVGKVVEFVLIVAAVAVAAMIATAPGFGVAIKKVLVSCAEVFTQAETLAKFATAIKKIGAFLITFLLGAMPGLIDKLIVLIVSFFMSLADAINAHATEIAIAIEKTVLALINVIVQTFVRLFFDALGWLGEMISGLLAKIPGVDTSKVTTVFDKIHDYGAGVAQKVAGLTDQAFESLDKELAEKTQQSIEKISQEAQDTLEAEEPNIVNKAETVGENSAQGAINAAESTITDNSNAVVEASADVSSRTGNTFIDTILDKISGRSSDVSDAAESTMEDAGESALSGWLTTLMDGTMLNSDALVGTGGDSSGFIMDGMMDGFSLDMPGVMETIPDEAKEYLDTKGYTLEDLGGMMSGLFTDGASAELPKGTEEYSEILVNQLDKNVESNKDKIKKIGVFASDEVRYGYLDQMVHHDAALIAGGTVRNINTEIQNKQSDISKIGTWFSEQFRIGYLAQMATDAVAMVRDTVSGLSEAVNNENSELYVIGVSLFEAIYQGYREAADQHSPSRVMQQEMAYTIQGLVVGAEKNAKNAFNAMEAVGDGMMDAMHNSMSRLALAVDRDYDIQPKITPIVDLGPASRGASALSNMMNGGTIRSIAESYRSMEGLAISGTTLNYTSQNAPVASAIDGLSKKMDRFTKSLDEDRNFNVDIRVDQMAVRDESDIRAISKQLAKEVRVALRQKGTR